MKTRSMMLLTLCFTVLFMFSFQVKTNADTSTIYEVGTSNLNVRNSPSENASVVGQLHAGEQVPVFKESHGWAQTYYGGEAVWVASHYLVSKEKKQLSKDTAQKSNSIQMTASGVNIRSGPGLDYSVVGSAASGDQFQLVDTAGEWMKIALTDGSGWVSGQFTKQSPTGIKPKPNNIHTTTSNGDLSGQTIILDPGHGGKDPGSIGFGHVYEKDLINSTTDNISRRLRKAGAHVILTRSQDSYISLDKRIHLSNVNQPDAFISIHFNAFPLPIIRGISTYYHSSGDSKRLARSLQSSLAQVNNSFDRGIRQGDYKVLRENNSVATLIELGFITNPEELQVIQSEAFQEDAAQAITDGLIRYFSN